MLLSSPVVIFKKSVQKHHFNNLFSKIIQNIYCKRKYAIKQNSFDISDKELLAIMIKSQARYNTFRKAFNTLVLSDKVLLSKFDTSKEVYFVNFCQHNHPLITLLRRVYIFIDVFFLTFAIYPKILFSYLR